MNTYKETNTYKRALLGFIFAALALFWQPASAAGNDPDVTGDGRVNTLDVSTVASCIGRDIVSVTRCACADTNGDGVIDKIDYNFVASKVGSSGYPLEPNACRAAKSPKEQVTALENAGVIPKLDRTSTVAGTDADSTGIRDDVEAFIVSHYQLTPQRIAARQFAAIMQAAMLVDKTDATAVKAISVRGTRAVNCIYAKFDGSNGSRQPSAVVSDIESISANTKARLLAYLAYNKALDGTSGALPEGDTCE